jgi:hypothetical protein
VLQSPWLYDPNLPGGGLGTLPNGYVLASAFSVVKCSTELPAKCSVRNDGVIVQLDTLIVFEQTLIAEITSTYNSASSERGLESRKWKLVYQLRNDEWILDESISLPES